MNCCAPTPPNSRSVCSCSVTTPNISRRRPAASKHAPTVIDLNCGCPVRKVVGGGAGSALLRDPVLVARIVAAVRRATDRPLTIKLRSGWDSQNRNYLEVARRAIAEGVDAVTLHPRTRTQMFGGRADWSELATLKAAVSVPVIASGDIFTAR